MPIPLKFSKPFAPLDEHTRIQRKVDNATGLVNRRDAMSVGAAPAAARPSLSSPAPPVLLQIQSSATGAGWYNAKLWLPPSTAPDPTAALTSAVLGTVATDDCYYANLSEVGKTTHDLTNAANTLIKLFVGIPWGSASDGKRIYISNGFWPEDCS